MSFFRLLLFLTSSILSVKSAKRLKHTFSIAPKTSNQQKYTDILADQRNRIVITIGPAGSGKTMLACNEAVRRLSLGIVRKVILVRPTVSVEDENLGFLPGSLEQKMNPWLLPIFDHMELFYTKREILQMMTDRVVEIVPLAFMRGRTFHHSIVLADEMQNSSKDQMLMLLTRTGEGTSVFVTGDLDQTDRKSGDNGIADFLCRYESSKKPAGIEVIYLRREDIVRDPVVADVLRIYESGSVASSSDVKDWKEKEAIVEAYIDSQIAVMDSQVANIQTDFSERAATSVSNDDAALIPLVDLQRSIKKGKKLIGDTEKKSKDIR